MGFYRDSGKEYGHDCIILGYILAFNQILTFWETSEAMILLESTCL